VSNRFCRKGCRPGYTIRPGRCVCDPIRNCQIKSCKKGFYLNSKKCACVKISKPIPVPQPPATSPPVSNNCHIKSCDCRYYLNQKSCRCKVKRGPICKIGCPRGMRVFPGKCKCVYPPKCPIVKCKSGFTLCSKRCKCVRKKVELPSTPSKPFVPKICVPKYSFPDHYFNGQNFNPNYWYQNSYRRYVIPEYRWAKRQMAPYTRNTYHGRKHIIGSSI
jgi:hypothetical protein